MPKWRASGIRPASICRMKPMAWCRPRKWKIRNFREKWYAGETISVSIGQGATTVTPIQLAAAIGGIAIGGMWFQPHLVKDARNICCRPGAADVQHGKHSKGRLWNVRGGERGTAPGDARVIPGIDVCGKTGTAQLGFE